MANVIGVFDNSSQAHTAVERMINAGIDRDQISLVTRDSDHEKDRDLAPSSSCIVTSPMWHRRLTPMFIPFCNMR